jgi:serine protease
LLVRLLICPDLEEWILMMRFPILPIPILPMLLLALTACQGTAVPVTTVPVTKPIPQTEPITDPKPVPVKEAISGTVGLGSSINLNGSGLAAQGQSAQGQSVQGESDVIPGRVILEFKPGLRTQSFSPLQARAQGQTRNLEPVRALAQGATLYALSGATRSETVQAAQTLAARSDVLYAEPDRRIHALQTSSLAAVTPNDPLFVDAWWLSGNLGSLNAVNAWKTSTGLTSTGLNGSGLGETVIAVIDTGVALNHPDLQDKILPGYDFISNVTIAADGDGRDANPDDPGDEGLTFHGSHVSGLAAASSNNSQGMTGVSWGSRLLPVRVLGVGGGAISDFVDAVIWSAGLPVAGVPTNLHPATVINASLGGEGTCSSATQTAIHRAIQAGSSVVVAAGNDQQQDAWNANPGNCDGVITVGASEPGGAFASYSNKGARLDLIAPGGSPAQGLTSTVKTTSGAFGYAIKSGTSMATPLVSGTVALIKSVNPNLTPAQIRTVLASSLQPMPGCPLPDADTCASGLLDAARALEITKALPAGAQADFDLQVARPVVANTSGTQAIQVPFQVITSNGFIEAINWSFEPNSSGITGSFANPSSTAGNTLTFNTLTLNTGAATPGTYTVRIKGSNATGTISRSSRLLVRVLAFNPPSLNNVQIKAFYLLGTSGFDSSKSKQVSIGNTTTGAFSVDGLEVGEYRVTAWKDMDANGTINAGDWYGVYQQAGLVARVKPPVATVKITLEVFSGSNGP